MNDPEVPPRFREAVFREKCVIGPLIAGKAFVERGFETGEIIKISPISLPFLSRHSLVTLRAGGDHGRDMGEKREG